MRAANRALIGEYIEYCRVERGRSRNTVYKYALSLDTLAQHLNQTLLADASTDDLRTWVHAPITKQRGARPVGSEPSPATVKRKVAEVRSLYRWLHEVRGLTQRNPALALAAPTVHNENPKPVHDDLWRSLWRSQLSTADRVAFGLAYFCGLRRFEVTSLQPGHVVDVPEARLIGFPRKGGKTANLPWLSCVRMYEQTRPDLIGGSARTFTEAFAELRELRVGKRILIPWADQQNPRMSRWKYAPPEAGHIDPFQFNHRLRRALLAADMPGDAFTPHQLRHSFCTNMLGMGVPLLSVSRLANHSSVVITQRYLATAEDPLADLLSAGDEGQAVVPAPY